VCSGLQMLTVLTVPDYLYLAVLGFKRLVSLKHLKKLHCFWIIILNELVQFIIKIFCYLGHQSWCVISKIKVLNL
jgi:hypothetical protein